MTILNLMLGRGRGGLEQAAFDYAEALVLAGIAARTLITPGAWVAAPLATAGIAYETLTNHGRWDMLAPFRLRRLVARTGARAILCHGNRALVLALSTFSHIPQNKRPAIIAIAHNYATRRFTRADACFAITQHLRTHLTTEGARNIALIPNMVRIPVPQPRPAFRHPPIIGAMGRFNPKKGFKYYIETLAVLKARGVPFHAILGGDGEEEEAIDTLITRYELQSHITRIGWVKDKPAFFASIDLFVQPSLTEAFGIALVEAMSHAVPVISTDAEGPSEIIHHGADGLLVRKADPEAIATAITELLTNPARAAALGQAAQTLATEEYSMHAMASRLQTALAPYI